MLTDFAPLSVPRTVFYEIEEPWSSLSSPIAQLPTKLPPADWPPEAIVFSLQGSTGKIIFLAPFAALSWAYSVVPGMRTLPPDLWEALAPFFEDGHGVWRPLNRPFKISQDHPIDDVALHLSTMCQGFDSVGEARSYAIKRGFVLADTLYEGVFE